MNWEYLEDTDQFINPDGLVYSFKNYSSQTDKYNFQRDFKIYESDKVQNTPELEHLAKTDSGNQKQIHYNQTWNYFKELLTQTLHSEEGSQIYAKRKIDVEPVFGRLKSVFGVRRVHVRGKQAVATEIAFIFMSMNHTKLAKNLASKTFTYSKTTQCFFQLDCIQDWNHCVVLFRS